MRQPASSDMHLKALPTRELLEYFLNDTTNSEAWKEFEARVRPVIQATVFRNLPSPFQAESRKELVQEVFFKLIDADYRRLRNLTWPYENAIFGWLRLVSRNTVIDWVRRYDVVSVIDIESPEAINKGDGKDHHKEAAARDSHRKTDRYLLSRTSKPHYQRDRNIFWLFYFWDYTDKAIARLSGINLPPKKVENIRRQLLLEVKRELNCESTDEPEDS
jgi:DNA-directed RNA polymerase specialized sigma24 family protein